MERSMANGWRTPGSYRLNEKEIKLVKEEIKRINVDENVFVIKEY